MAFIKNYVRPLSLLILTCIGLSMLGGRGVMFGGSRFQGRTAVKEHPQADIYANGYKIGTGSAVALFKRNRPLEIEVRQDGCEPVKRKFYN